MKYQKQQSIGGAWVKGSEVQSGSRCKLMSETSPMQSQFKNEKTGEVKMQDVAKILFSGDTEEKNISLNRATINGLIDAFGDDSALWQGQVLTAETEKVRVAGKAVTAVYLVPEGYERVDDENGYTVIVKKGTQVGAPEELPSIDF
ncbi:MAG TPA: hypothetical protein VGG72_21375 [Bryobacteraceae bacterium]|jgi:hypothetical protein